MEEIDRLSDLPDGILHHILSSLDTKSVVQTSVLSSRWKLVWKQVRILNFRRSSFGTDLGFMQHVDQVLSFRSDCDVLKISTDFRIGRNLDMFGRIMEYAAFHGVQQLSLLRIIENEWYSVFSDAIAMICGCYQTLKVLELQRACLNKTAFEMLSGLELLETLTLQSSHFEFSGVNEPQDPFANFPKLKNLQLLHCSSVSLSADDDSNRVLVVSGPQLLCLEIHRPQFDSIEICAPKLKSFTYWSDVLPHLLPTEGSNWNLPSLRHATLDLLRSKDVILYFNAEQKQLLLKQFVNLFHALRDVESLSLHLDTIELLIQACNSVKHQPSPFRRLESLSLLYSNGSFSSVPYQVLRFFLEGSPNVGDKYLTVDKRPRAKKHELVIGSSVPRLNLTPRVIPESATRA